MMFVGYDDQQRWVGESLLFDYFTGIFTKCEKFKIDVGVKNKTSLNRFSFSNKPICREGMKTFSILILHNMW